MFEAQFDENDTKKVNQTEETALTEEESETIVPQVNPVLTNLNENEASTPQVEITVDVPGEEIESEIEREDSSDQTHENDDNFE